MALFEDVLSTIQNDRRFNTYRHGLKSNLMRGTEAAFFLDVQEIKKRADNIYEIHFWPAIEYNRSYFAIEILIYNDEVMVIRKNSTLHYDECICDSIEVLKEQLNLIALYIKYQVKVKLAQFQADYDIIST